MADTCHPRKKRCSRCKTIKFEEHFYADRKSMFGLSSRCKSCAIEVSREHKTANRERLAGLERARQADLRKDPLWREKENARLREYEKQIRLQCLEAYGGLRCSCKHKDGLCGPKPFEFLAIDHIGGKNGKPVPDSQKIARRLKALGYPPGYRNLCHNCNSAIGFYGRCPQEE